MASPFTVKDLELSWRRVKNDIVKERDFVNRAFEVALVEIELGSWIQSIHQSLEDGTYNPGPMLLCDVPKSGHTIRSAAYLSLVDRVVFFALVGSLYKDVYTTIYPLRDIDFSFHVNNQAQDADWALGRGFNGWSRFREKSLKKIEEGVSHVVISDITTFFDNIDISVLSGDLRAIGSDVHIVSLLAKCLNKWAICPGRGIPQGYTASDVLAKLYLASTDQIFRSSGYTHFRYVDDIRIFCSSRTEARQAVITLTNLLKKRGLSLQSAKTKILEKNDAIEAINGIQPYLESIHESYQARKGSQVSIEIPGDYDEPVFMEIQEIEPLDLRNPPIEIIVDAFENFFLKDRNFDKTLFHFLLKKLGSHKSKFAVSFCEELLEHRPEETKYILDYFIACEAAEETQFTLAKVIREQIEYPFQAYQILAYILQLNVCSSIELLACVRSLVIDKGKPWYVISLARAILSFHGSNADFEMIASDYAATTDPIEQSEILCCLKKMEKGTRNALIARAEGDGELQRRAVRLVKSGMAV